jgi:hypothetical protein
MTWVALQTTVEARLELISQLGTRATARSSKNRHQP